MNTLTRRGFVVAGAAALGGCANGAITGSASQIDANVDDALTRMYASIPGSRAAAQDAAALLVMPSVTKGGLFIGGSYGEGALRIGNATVDYFSVASASLGWQIGGQQYSHVLFFMTPEALRDFRISDGWQIGVDAEVVVEDEGGAVGLSSTTSNRPVIAVVFGNRGLIVGASLAGAKYSRLVR
ncbi:MAG: lipid-binding SYLF domain-containing protein [Paracoccaceae bacterium]